MYHCQEVENIQRICKTPAQFRSQVQLETLYNVIKDIKLFKDLASKYGQTSLLSCMSNLNYEFSPAENYIFRYGDIGTKFYIIISGTVSISIPFSDSGRIVFREVMTYNSGSYFGELALETLKPRSASALCKTETHFLTLSQKDYSKYMQRLVFEKKNEMIYFLQSLPAFNKLNKMTIARLTYNIKEVYYTKGQVIFNEGDSANEILIIKEGECKLMKTFPVSPSGLKKIVIRRNLTAKKIGRGSMIAEDDIIEKQKHSYSCICSSERVTIYVISSEDFFSRITAEQPLRIIRQASKDKKEFFDCWSNSRKSLDLLLSHKDQEIKSCVRKKRVSEFDNLAKLKRIMSKRRKDETEKEEFVSRTPVGEPLPMFFGYKSRVGTSTRLL